MVTQRMEHCPPKLPSDLQGLWVASALPRHDAHEIFGNRCGVAWWLHIMGSEACLTREHSRESELPHGVAQILAPKAWQERQQTHLKAHRKNALWRASAKAACQGCMPRLGGENHVAWEFWQDMPGFSIFYKKHLSDLTI